MNLRWPSNDADRDHDRRPGGPQLGALAADLHRRRHARLRLAAAQRSPDLTDERARPRLHRVLGVAGPRRPMDEAHRIRPDGEPDDISDPVGAGQGRGVRRCAFRRPADPRSRSRLERERARDVRHPLPHRTGALRAARDGDRDDASPLDQDRTEGIATMRDIWTKTTPKPARNPIRLLLGGKGVKRTLPLVAREAAEWNLSRLDPEMFRQRRELLEQLCRDIGRDPATIKRSIMTTYVIGRNQDELRKRAALLSELLPNLRGKNPDEVLATVRPSAFVGTPDEIAGQMREHAKLGVDLFMLQHFLLDDSDALELLAKEVIPAVA